MLASAAESSGKSYFFLPDDSLSLKWYTAASHYYLIDSDSSGFLRCINKMGLLCTRSGKFDQAIEEYNILSSAYTGKKDLKNLANTYNQI